MNALFVSIAASLLSGLLHTDPQTPASATSFAVGVYPKQNTSKLNVMLENPGHKRLNLSLVNPDNQVVYQETLGRKTTKYWRRLDMAELPDGVYQLRISDGKETQTREINLSTHRAEPILPEKFISVR